ncbi:MAG: AmmeMemoRadiSam system radical SAM enzyme [Bacteroidota bacterium]|nr:AmmeMemoRadiSam system radical SAM enzyme [Bacteroidota bacterium]
MDSPNKIDKRSFLKYCLYGSCGLAMGLSLTDSLARNLDKIVIPGPSGDDELWKWSKEAMHYIKTPKGVKCKLCPQACNIKHDEIGDCRTRTNINGKLYSIAYGNPCAVHVDPIEKKPLYHFLPSSNAFSIATAGCNLACLNCQNWNISQISPLDSRNYDLMPADVIRDCKSYKCSSIAYTYTDPVAFYEYTFDTAKMARMAGIRNVFISAGYINEQPLREICQLLDAANIDLKSFSNETYEMLNAGTLEPVLNTLKILKEENVWLEITNLVVPGWTDDFDMIRKMCDWLYDHQMHDYPLHFSRFHPQYKLTKIPPTPFDTLEKARKIAMESGLKYVYIGNVPGSDAENTYCPACKKIVIERKGYKIVTNNLVDGECKACKEKIAGVWE